VSIRGRRMLIDGRGSLVDRRTISWEGRISKWMDWFLVGAR
jgi:hypothetical protein